MTKPREKTREELQAEIEDGKKKIRQFENREKMLRQKLSKEERRTRSHRLIVRGAVFESIVPEAKDMTDEEAAALLNYHSAVVLPVPDFELHLFRPPFAGYWHDERRGRHLLHRRGRGYFRGQRGLYGP